jgi:hypothetical protein
VVINLPAFARSYAAVSLERIALLTLGAAASDAMPWRAFLDHEENAETGKSKLSERGSGNVLSCASREAIVVSISDR